MGPEREGKRERVRDRERERDGKKLKIIKVSAD